MQFFLLLIFILQDRFGSTILWWKSGKRSWVVGGGKSCEGWRRTLEEKYCNWWKHMHPFNSSICTKEIYLQQFSSNPFYFKRGDLLFILFHEFLFSEEICFYLPYCDYIYIFILFSTWTELFEFLCWPKLNWSTKNSDILVN